VTAVVVSLRPEPARPSVAPVAPASPVPLVPSAGKGPGLAAGGDPAAVDAVAEALLSPLTTVIGALDLLDAGVLGALPRDAGALVRAATCAARLATTRVEALLDLALAERGALHLRPRPASLHELLAHAVARVCTARPGATVDFEARDARAHAPTDAPAPHDVRVVVDARRFERSVEALLDNAVVHGDGGPVRLAVALRAGQGVRLAVRNGGPPISAAARARLYRPLAGAGSPDGAAGPGLSLASARVALDAMGCALDYVSDESGTVFFVDAPACAEPRSA
jgi:signal transduction histidine kinase